MIVLLRASVLLTAFFLLPFAGGIVCCVKTWGGYLVGLSLGLVGLGPLLWCIGDERGSQTQVRFAKVVLLLGIIGLSGAVLRSPDGRTAESSHIHSRSADQGWCYPRFTFGNILPELDQIHLGYAVALAVDPMFNRTQKGELAAMTDSIYADMAEDDDFAACGSALPAIYDEITFAEFRAGHYFHYVPPRVNRDKPSPLIVFLHGSGGNFKAYIWLLSKVADRAGCCVVAPTFGLGNWEQSEGAEAVLAAVRDAGRFALVDPEQIHLMGLSNGGKGVCATGVQEGMSFRSVILVSAVLHSRITPENLSRRLGPRPLLIFSGLNDDRVPWDYVSQYAAAFEKSGMQVSLREFEGEDHFLFFRKRGQIQDMLVNWLQSCR